MSKKEFIPDPHKNPYRVRNSPQSHNNPGNPEFIDFNTQRVCPSCGGIIKISHNFCKYCGVDLSRIEAIGTTDEISKQLAITAVSDPNAEVRKEAVDTLGNFGDTKVLGVLTYVMLHDTDPEVRREVPSVPGGGAHPHDMPDSVLLEHLVKYPRKPVTLQIQPVVLVTQPLRLGRRRHPKTPKPSITMVSRENNFPTPRLKNDLHFKNNFPSGYPGLQI